MTQQRGRATTLAGGTVLLLLTWSSVARANVYYYQDAQGVFHFSNVPTPDSKPFVLEEPLANGAIPAAPAPTLPAKLALPATEFDAIILEYAERYDIEAALVKAMIHVESGFNRFAVSPRGARGLMQLMPKTARLYGVRNPYDARQNVEGGVKHLRALMDVYGGHRLSHVLAAYNAGSLPVNRYRGIPPYRQTRNYVARVLRYRQQYQRDERLRQIEIATNL